MSGLSFRESNKKKNLKINSKVQRLLAETSVHHHSPIDQRRKSAFDESVYTESLKKEEHRELVGSRLKPIECLGVDYNEQEKQYDAIHREKVSPPIGYHLQSSFSLTKKHKKPRWSAITSEDLRRCMEMNFE